MSALQTKKNPGIAVPGSKETEVRCGNVGWWEHDMQRRVDAMALSLDSMHCDPALLALVVDLADHLMGDPDIEQNGDELDTSLFHDEREAVNEDGTDHWPETHGFGHVQDWAYHGRRWNVCSPTKSLFMGVPS